MPLFLVKTDSLRLCDKITEELEITWYYRPIKKTKGGFEHVCYSYYQQQFS